MNNLYITQSGKLKRKDNTLLFQNNKIRKVIPIQGIETIYALGEIDINTKLLVFLQQNKITLHFFNYYGFYSGSFYPRESYISGSLYIKQVEHFTDYEKRLTLARKFVSGIAQNLRYLLRHYSKHGIDIAGKMRRIQNYSNKLNMAKTIKEILQIEGAIWDIFYSSFLKILNDSFKFTRRIKRPPDNPINAMISFGNSMLYTRVLSSIYFTQLNPTISYLHEPFERRFSLSLDLSEVFKPSLVFQIIFKLVNMRMITLKNFSKKLNYCYLNEEGRRIFVKEFDNKLRKSKKHPLLKRSISNKTLIKLECYKIIKHLLAEKDYLPFNIGNGY